VYARRRATSGAVLSPRGFDGVLARVELDDVALVTIEGTELAVAGGVLDAVELEESISVCTTERAQRSVIALARAFSSQGYRIVRSNVAALSLLQLLLTSLHFPPVLIPQTFVILPTPASRGRIPTCAPSGLRI